MKWLPLFLTVFLFFLFAPSFAAEGDSADIPDESSAAAEDRKTPISLPAEKEFTPPKQISENIFLDTGAKLLIVLGCIYLFFLFLRKVVPASFSAKVPSRKLGVTASFPLAGRNRLVLVRFGSKLILMAVSSDSAEKIAETADPEEIDTIYNALSEMKSRR